MLNLKKLSVVLITLSSHSLFAGTMGPVCTPGNVTVPCQGSAWDVGITALYLKPVEDADWAYIGIAPDGQYTNWGHRFKWGFKLDTSYYFNTGNDLNINWSHFKPTTNGLYTIADRHFHQVLQWDAVNAEMGQFVDFSANKKIRFHGGLQYVKLQANLDNYRGDTFFTHTDSHFSGVGPRTGIDMNYVLGHGVGVYAKAAAALLVGSSHFYDGVYLNTGSKRAIVPELEAKLGGDYTYAMKEGRLIIDAGYMWFNYFNGLHNTLPLFSGFGGLESDFSASGPYVGLKYVGSL